MDPKKINHLDPKLQEVYERVMGTTVAKPTGQTSPATPPAAKPTTSEVSAAINQPPMTANPIMPMPQMQKNGVSTTIIVAIVVVLFFILYIVFWMWYFKLPLPFTLPF